MLEYFVLTIDQQNMTCITCITLNYCLTEVLLLGNRLYSSGSLTTKGYFCMKICIHSYFHSQFASLQFTCKDCTVT